LQSNAEDSDPSGTLPREELNPLLNPLLSENMGRWAEVYFKAAPEDREQAVEGLLHELRAGSPPPEASPRESSPSSFSSLQTAGQTTAQDGFEAHESDDPGGVVRCPQCGHENPRDYNFCGACRAPLAAGGGFSETRAQEQQAASFLLDPIVDPEFESDRDAKQSSLPGHLWQKDLDPQQIQEQRSRRRKWNIAEPGRVATPVNRDDAEGQVPDRTGHYFDLDRNRSGDPDLFQLPSLVEPRRSYRLYIGAAMALLIGFLAYRAWRAEQPTLFSAHTAPQVPAVASDGSSAPAAERRADLPQANPASTPASQPNASSQPQAAPSSGNSAPRSNASSSAANSSAASENGVEEAAEKAPAPARTTPPSPQSQSNDEATTMGGWSELAMAKNYLNGTGGKEQNSAEAAAWLWKAVSKQNAEASTLLAELYMKGEGVSKSCDQGRVLLDAAARKGRKDAAERLSHLGAFGCQ
jgi:hypothetical protein